VAADTRQTGPGYHNDHSIRKPLAWPRALTGLLAAGYTAATLGALIISLSVGLFGFRESISASFVTESLAIETITVLALLIWTALAALPGMADSPGRPSLARPGPPRHRA
jgi:hypothetical protein